MKVLLLISNRQTSSVVHKNQTPVALTKCGGKYLLEYLLNEILLITEEDVDEIIFITSFSIARYHNALKQIATKFGLKTNIFTCLRDNSQLEALECAIDSLKGPVLILPTNAWFKGGDLLSIAEENRVLVSKVDDPSEHNVIKVELNNAISGFSDHSAEYVSDLSPVGGYFFKNGESLIEDIQVLVKEQEKSEELFDLNTLVMRRIKGGELFVPSVLESWISCVQANDLLEIHENIIAGFNKHGHIADSAEITNTVIVSPVYIGKGAKVSNSVVGPGVSIGDYAMVKNTLVENSIIADYSEVNNVSLKASILGEHAIYTGKEKQVNLGEYSYLKE